MALLNRFFPNKKKSHKQGYVPFGKSDHSGWKPFHFTRGQVRLLLFRECDARGRKLLFDSSAVQKILLENQPCSKIKSGFKPKCDNPKKTETYVEVTNGVGYQYTRPSSDVTLMGEMIFGSVAMTFKGMTSKVHCMKSPDRIMCSRVFHAPTVQCSSKRRSDQSIESSGSSVSSLNDSLFSLSENHETKLKMSNCTGPLDVPRSATNGKGPSSSLEGDSGFCGDASLHSISSIGSGFWGPNLYGCDTQSGSCSTLGHSSNSGGSLASLQRRWMKNISTSLERGVNYSPWHFMRRKNSSGMSEESTSRLHRKTQLGLTVVIDIPQDQEKDLEVFFEHIAIVDGILERLQSSIEKAYVKKEVFVHLMMDTFHKLQQWLCDFFTAPRLTCPIWIGLVSPEFYQHNSRFRSAFVTTFLRDFCQLISAIDTKATNFFISTLVTAVLTHHLGWVATIMPAKAPPNSVTKPPCAVQMLHALAKSHPYNALWAQLGDLHGALGNPVKIARTIVTANGKKSDLLNKLLTSLSYFIRSGNLEKRLCSEIPVGKDVDALDSIIENVSSISLNSSTASSSTIVPDDSTNYRKGDVEAQCNECKIFNNIKTAGSGHEQVEKFDFFSAKTDVESSLNSHSVSTFKKSRTFVSGLDLSPKLETNPCESSNSKLYPDIKEIDNEYLHPDVISEKVSRLCRIPTNAVLYHLKNNDPELNSVKKFLPRRVDCEKQLSSVQSNSRGKFLTESKNNVKHENEAKRSEASPSDCGVVFVLGDNEQLVNLKSQNGLSLPKSKSENILCCEDLDSDPIEIKNCYPSLEGLSSCARNSHVSQVQKIRPDVEQSESDSVAGKVNGNRIDCDVSAKTFSNLHEKNPTSFLGEHLLISKSVSGGQDFLCQNVIPRNSERTSNCVCKNKQSAALLAHDANRNSKVDRGKNTSSCKVVTSHSFVIELEDVYGNIPVERRKMSKHVARSQSLSFPDRKSSTCKKNVSICRRHSENMHVNDRYLRDYHSVRFNFERCHGVLSDYVDGTGMDKSPQTDKKSMKISEARGNFEFLEKMCGKCKPRDQGTSALCGGDCAHKSNVSQECRCKEQCSTDMKGEVREGNALFDEYGRLSDDELQPSNEVPDVKRTDVVTDNVMHPSLINLPLPWLDCSQREQSWGLAASLLGGVADHYMPDMVLHGCTQALPQWEATLKHDLLVCAHRPMLDQEVSEAVCIIGNAELWEVQLVSSHISVVDKPGGFGIRVGMSQLVANMLESLVHLWKLRAPPEQCLQHLESKLRELCLRSQALAELLLTTELCDLATLTSALDLEANDVPLLLAIASTHTPQVTNLYGLSFR